MKRKFWPNQAEAPSSGLHEQNKEGTLWRHFWRVAGRESGFPDLLTSPWTSHNFRELRRNILGGFPGTSLTVDFKNAKEGVVHKLGPATTHAPSIPRARRNHHALRLCKAICPCLNSYVRYTVSFTSTRFYSKKV